MSKLKDRKSPIEEQIRQLVSSLQAIEQQINTLSLQKQQKMNEIFVLKGKLELLEELEHEAKSEIKKTNENK